MVLHVCFESLYISWLSSAKHYNMKLQSRTYFGECVLQMAHLSRLPLELNTVITYLVLTDRS